MRRSSVLCVTLIASFCSLGSLFQTPHLLGIPDSFKTSQSPSRSGVTSEAVFVEGSGYDAGDVKSPQCNTERVILKESGRKHFKSGITLSTRLALSAPSSEVHNPGADSANSDAGDTHSSGILEETSLDKNHRTAEEHKSHSSTFLSDGDKLPVRTSLFTFLSHPSLSGPRGPCVLGVASCAVFNSINGTTLLWDDMRRTLAFAWELHVFGSAALFALMAVLAVVGMVGARTLPHPFRDGLTLSNGLLVLGAALRAALLLLDPYGTRQVLPHATLAALHNAPLQLLLWTQVALALVSLKRFKLILFPLKLQHMWLVGWLGVTHCSALLTSDLYSSALSPAVPLLLQTLSLCWGVPFCLGILTKSFSNLQHCPSSFVPQWVPSQRTERLGKRVVAVCAFLGVFCCSLHMYSLLWLYGLLGNWRRFGWGWWLTQFWARILELAWGFSMLFLGSWIFWTPSKGRAKGGPCQGRNEVCKRVEKKSLWQKILAGVQKGRLRKSERSWEDLMPNNWAKLDPSRAGISSSPTYDGEASTIKSDYSSDPVSCSSDSQTAFLWQKVGERECVLSLIEYDMRPSSPINLRRTTDNLYHGQLVAGSMFTPPPPSWTQTTGAGGGSGPTAFPPAYVGYRWMMDTESISASLDHFQAKEPAQSPDCNGSIGSPAAGLKEEAFSAVMHQPDWSDDDITDL
ncbi:proline-rich transmembrane protein 3 isoform X2 [Austrofundulus limnaeus]|uniref:Proline-rich transmembrane protein 3 isoform X2 n=1 Tax=Austrofundulus limnaeus TaxID=52670 RepID=A0A2I4B299_AUSLI|nr:PREDICTED: proline-rich transmembrane protein 3-like isoform X2 [Austrofundulus limnaeus]